jgi:hypothetical protein
VNLPDLPVVGKKDRFMNNHDSHNLIESEALALQGGRTPTYGVLTAEEGVRQLRIDEFDNAYTTYKSFAPDGSYTVELGKHRLVVLNSKYDSGIPPVLDLLNFLHRRWQALGCS